MLPEGADMSANETLLGARTVLGSAIEADREDFMQLGDRFMIISDARLLAERALTAGAIVTTPLFLLGPKPALRGRAPEDELCVDAKGLRVASKTSSVEALLLFLVCWCFLSLARFSASLMSVALPTCSKRGRYGL